jgi:hypothetical protein
MITTIHDPAKEPDLQTMTVVGIDNRRQYGSVARAAWFFATKLWNTALWHKKEVWTITGEILTTLSSISLSSKNSCSGIAGSTPKALSAR